MSTIRPISIAGTQVRHLVFPLTKNLVYLIES